MRYKLSPAIKRDLHEIAQWISQDNPSRAIKVIQNLRTEFGKIAHNPLFYQIRADIGEDARLAVVGPHVILFVIEDKMVRFERVVHGSRDLPSLYQ